MVILGAGHTGGRAAHALREAGWNGPVTLIGAEPSLPYERPPLSKGMLSGEKAPGDFALYPEEDYARLDIRHLASATVVEIRRGPHEVALADGAVVAYERLLIATGAEPRRLAVPGADLAGVLVLRDVADAELLRDRIGPGKRLIVLGGGFIGLEVASHAVSIGAEVTGGRGRSAFADAGRSGRDRGADARPPSGGGRRSPPRPQTWRRPRRRRASPASVSMTAAKSPPTPCSIAIGIVPRVELAEAAGLAVDNGIVVDRISAPRIPISSPPATSAPSPTSSIGGHVRLESWKNAEEQGPIVARNMLGGNEVAASCHGCGRTSTS